MIQAHATMLNGSRPWRVTDAQGRPLRTRHGKPIDRGGYEKAALANEQAAAINRASAVNARAASRPTKRQRLESRRAVKRAQRERMQQAFEMKNAKIKIESGAA